MRICSLHNNTSLVRHGLAHKSHLCKCLRPILPLQLPHPLSSPLPAFRHIHSSPILPQRPSISPTRHTHRCHLTHTGRRGRHGSRTHHDWRSTQNGGHHRRRRSTGRRLPHWQVRPVGRIRAPLADAWRGVACGDGHEFAWSGRRRKNWIPLVTGRRLAISGSFPRRIVRLCAQGLFLLAPERHLVCGAVYRGTVGPDLRRCSFTHQRPL